MLTSDTNIRNRARDAYALQATNAVQFFAGSLVGLQTTTGRAVLWSDTAGLRFIGVSKTKVLGDTTAAIPPEVIIDGSGIILEKTPVTGVTGLANVGDLVYATDDNTLTLTATGNVNAIGWIVRRISGTSCDVQLFTPHEYRAFIAA